MDKYPGDGLLPRTLYDTSKKRQRGEEIVGLLDKLSGRVAHQCCREDPFCLVPWPDLMHVVGATLYRTHCLKEREMGQVVASFLSTKLFFSPTIWSRTESFAAGPVLPLGAARVMFMRAAIRRRSNRRTMRHPRPPFVVFLVFPRFFHFPKGHKELTFPHFPQPPTTRYNSHFPKNLGRMVAHNNPVCSKIEKKWRKKLLRIDPKVGKFPPHRSTRTWPRDLPNYLENSVRLTKHIVIPTEHHLYLKKGSFCFLSSAKWFLFDQNCPPLAPFCPPSRVITTTYDNAQPTTVPNTPCCLNWPLEWAPNWTVYQKWFPHFCFSHLQELQTASKRPLTSPRLWQNDIIMSHPSEQGFSSERRPFDVNMRSILVPKGAEFVSKNCTPLFLFQTAHGHFSSTHIFLCSPPKYLVSQIGKMLPPKFRHIHDKKMTHHKRTQNCWFSRTSDPPNPLHNHHDDIHHHHHWSPPH